MADELLRAFQFRIKLRKSAAAEAGDVSTSVPDASASGEMLGDGGFQECSGLSVDMDIQELYEGGRNDGVIRRAGRAKYTNVVLKRGMFYGGEGQVNRDIWGWFQSAVAGELPIPRYDGFIEVMSVGETVVATWVFERGLPAKVSGPTLNAQTGEIAIEELHIAHEGLRLVAS